MSAELQVRVVSGPGLAPAIPQLSRLRLQVFRDYPYLYVGDEAYEARYLQAYLESPQAVVVLVQDGDRVVGASSALPLQAEQAELRAPWEAARHDTAPVWYLAESVLDARYRGQGLGVRFFEERERVGRELGYRTAAFCAVLRPADHPRRPAGYVPLDAFWAHRGYTRRPELVARLPWQDLDEQGESPKEMMFWTKAL
jgi:GNAT superfamily N-acetyltransferase